MADSTAATGEADRKQSASANRSGLATWLTGLGIMVFTLAVAFISVIFLASTLTQTRMSGLVVDGVTLTIWKLDSIRQNWALIGSQIEKQMQALTAAEIKRTASNSRRSAANEKFRAALGRLNPLLEQFNYRVRPFDQALATQLSGKGPAEQLGRIQSVRNDLKRDHPELEPLMNSIEIAYRSFEPAAVEHEAAEAEGKALVAEISQLQDGITGSQKSLAQVFNSIKENLDPANRARIESALYELKPTGGAIGQFINRLVTAQPEVLTLTLVILMGVLGSSLQITNSFFRGSRDNDVGNYFLQVCVGAIAALVIFVVAKAGVPLFTDTSKIGGEAPINPYFVSFIAIISGLLSERAILSIQSQGERFFGSNAPDEPSRWTRQDLTPELSGQKLSAGALASYLGVPEATVEAILKGEQTADPAQQKLIAIYLRLNPRDVFTDMPPDVATAGASA